MAERLRLRYRDSALSQASIPALREVAAACAHWREVSRELDALLSQTHDDEERRCLTDLLAEVLFQQTRLATLIACLSDEQEHTFRRLSGLSTREDEHEKESVQ